MTKKTQKQILFERMNSVAGMPLNENYPWGAEHDPAAPWNEPEFPENGEEEYGEDPDRKHDERDEIDEEADSPKRWNNVSIWINQASEEDMKNAGLEFDPKGNADLFYNGKKVGFVSNFNGVMLDDEYVDELVPIFQNFRGTGVWNYDNWRKDADERKRYFGGAQGLQEDDKWIQKAVDPAHKGYCTPMTKDTCTPRRKALAKRFKKGIEDEGVQEDLQYSTPEEDTVEYKGKVEKLKQTMDKLFNEEYYDVIDTLFRLLVSREKGAGQIPSLHENTDASSVGHNIYNDVMALINYQTGDEVWSGGAEGALNFYEKVLEGLRDAMYQDLGDSVNKNSGAAPDEIQ